MTVNVASQAAYVALVTKNLKVVTQTAYVALVTKNLKVVTQTAYVAIIDTGAPPPTPARRRQAMVVN